MFDVAPSELIVLGTVALLVIPPKDLPKALRTAGYWVGRARSVARQFRAGFDDMLRDAELKEMEARWKAENERIMREHPMPQMMPLGAPHDPDAPHSDAAHEPPAGIGEEAPVTLVEKPAVKEAAPTKAAASGAPAGAAEIAPKPDPAP